jgi:hypothetical protein
METPSTEHMSGKGGTYGQSSKMNYFVYIIQENRISKKRSDNKYMPIKIGVSKSIERRLEAMQTGNPRELTLLVKIGPFSKAQAYSLEKKAHRIVKSLGINGEWFQGSALPILMDRFSK